MNLTNSTLIERVKNKLDEDSWEEFTNWYKPYINAILVRSGIPYEQVDDVTQEILLKLWKGMESFEYDPDNCKFRSWLFKVCKNKVYSYFKKNKNNLKYISITEEHEVEGESELDVMIEKEWQIYVAKKAFDKVKSMFQPHVIEIYIAFQKGQTTEEISKTYDVAENTVYVYNKRVKEAMNREIILLTHQLE